jgi:hypothetical protein
MPRYRFVLLAPSFPSPGCIPLLRQSMARRSRGPSTMTTDSYERPIELYHPEEWILG